MKTLFVSSLLFLSVCLAYELPHDQALKIAEHSVHELHVMMKKNIMEQMSNGGVIKAAKFCANDSYKAIQNLSEQLGQNVQIKRVSLRNRNILSYPSDDEIGIIKAFALIERSNAFIPKTIIQMKDENKYKVYFPSTMSSKNCKLCHGKSNEISEEVKVFLREKYPDDKAIEFVAGEVRGAVVVEITLENNKEK